MAALDDNSSDENSPVVKNPNPSRHRRGLAGRLKLQNTENSDDLAALETAIYSTQVSKCFSSKSGSIPLLPEIITDPDDDESENTDDAIIGKRRPSLPRQKRHMIDFSFDDEDTDLYLCCTPPAGNTSVVTLASPSPPPCPPSPPKELNCIEQLIKKKPKISKAVKKALSNLSETKTQLQVSHHRDLDNSLNTSDVVCVEDEEEEDNRLTLKIKHGTNTYRFPIMKNDFFKNIMSALSARLSVSENQILLIHNDETVRSEDTPKSLGLTTADIISCHVNREEWTETPADDSLESVYHITLYIQSENHRNKMEFKVDKTLPLDGLMRKYATKTDNDPSKLRLVFDGENLDLRDSADDLELEDGFTLDLVMK